MTSNSLPLFAKTTSLLFGCIFSFSTLPALAQSQDNSQNFVVGGENAPNEYPFFVNIVEAHEINDAIINPFCGGTLISKDWVLTAGHCVINFFTGNTYDSLGLIINTYIRSNPNTSHERIISDYIAVHPNFDIFGTDLDGDIALIHLKTPSAYPTLAIAAQGDSVNSKPGNNALVIGFGIFDTGNPFLAPDTLQRAFIDIISNTICNEPGRYNGVLSEGMLCAGRLTGLPQGAGAGDSGGPLMVDSNGHLVQVGIVSFGNDAFSTPTHPGVYTRTAAYRNWIDSTIQAYNNPTSVASKQSERAKIHVSEYAIQITTEKPMPENASYRVYDLQGRIVLSGNLQAGIFQQAIYSEELDPALYVIKIDAGSSYYFTEKFIKN